MERRNQGLNSAKRVNGKLPFATCRMPRRDAVITSSNEGVTITTLRSQKSSREIVPGVWRQLLIYTAPSSSVLVSPPVTPQNEKIQICIVYRAGHLCRWIRLARRRPVQRASYGRRYSAYRPRPPLSIGPKLLALDIFICELDRRGWLKTRRTSFRC